MAVNQRLLQALMNRHMAAALPATTRRDPVTRAPGLLEQWQQQYPYQQGRPEMGFDPAAAQANIVPGLVERGMDVRTMIEEPVETGVGLAELAKGALQVAGAAPAMAVGSRRAREAARRRLEGNPVAMMLRGGIREMRDLVGEKGVMGALGSMANRPVDVAEMMLGVTPAGAVPRAAKAAKAAKAARRPWGAKAPVEEFGEQVLQKHGLADLEIYEVGDDIKISMIAVPKDQQGQGIGSAAMQDIVDFADQHGKRLILTPGPIESRWGQTSTASQKRFYKKFGFVENKGDDKDFRIKDSMYRAPQELQAASEPDDFWQWMLKEMPEGPEKELLRKEATEGRAKAAQLEKFITETEPAPTRIPWNLGGDPNRPAQMIITPSVKEPGRWQGTLIDERGPISDINRDTYEEVIRELAGDYNLDLSKAEVRAAPKAQTLEERAAAVGYTRPAYHGSTHDIREFELNRANVENHLGQAHYFTTSPKDASANYGGMGPDLTQRIQLEVERMDDVPVEELLDMVDDTVKRRYTERMQVAKSEGMRDEIDSQLLMEAAKARLKGPSEGMVYDVQLRLDNPLYIDGSKKEPVFEIETVYDDAGDFVEERGNGLDLVEAMHDAAADFDGDAEAIVREFMETGGDQMLGGMKASEVDSALRSLNSLHDLYDEASWQSAGTEFIRRVYENLGYDSVIMDPKKAFPHMADVPEGTRHYIVFDKYANKIRSKRAAFDPKKLGSRDILATVTPIAAPGLAAGYLATQEQE